MRTSLCLLVTTALVSACGKPDPKPNYYSYDQGHAACEEAFKSLSHGLVVVVPKVKDWGGSGDFYFAWNDGSQSSLITTQKGLSSGSCAINKATNEGFVTLDAKDLGWFEATFDKKPKLDIHYVITKDESSGPLKRTVEVLLNQRISEEALRQLAKKIKDSVPQKFDRTFIGYNLKGSNSSTYWATTHYTPDLEIKILGSTVLENERLHLKSTDVPGEIIGEWKSNRVGEIIMIAYENGEGIFIKSLYHDGSESVILYEKSERAGKIILQKLTSSVNGEFFAISPRGDLEFWSKNGLYYTAPKMP